MAKGTRRECPNCKTVIQVVFSGGRFEAEVECCPGCGSMVLLCPDGCIVESSATLNPLEHQSVWRARGNPGDHPGPPGKILAFRPGDDSEPPPQEEE